MFIGSARRSARSRNASRRRSRGNRPAAPGPRAASPPSAHLGEIFGNRQRVPHLEPVMDEARDEDRRRQQQNLGARVGIVRRRRPPRIRAGELGQQPAAERPRGIVLAADGQDASAMAEALFRFLPSPAQGPCQPEPTAGLVRSGISFAAPLRSRTGAPHALPRLPRQGRRGDCDAPSGGTPQGMSRSRLPGARAAPSRRFAAYDELMAHAGFTHKRPDFEIPTVRSATRTCAVRGGGRRDAVRDAAPFQEGDRGAEPRVLLVAPMSGHFATLLRDTVRTMLADHDVYVTDWHNARDVAPRHGTFGFDAFIEHIIRFLETMGEGSHILAVCQPCVARWPRPRSWPRRATAQPRSMTLMAGPVDTRVSPTRVNEFATQHSMGWFERQRDRRRAAIACGARQGLSRLRSARRLHVDECRAAHQIVPGRL